MIRPSSCSCRAYRCDPFVRTSCVRYSGCQATIQLWRSWRSPPARAATHGEQYCHVVDHVMPTRTYHVLRPSLLEDSCSELNDKVARCLRFVVYFVVCQFTSVPALRSTPTNGHGFTALGLNININSCSIKLKWDGKTTEMWYDNEMRWIRIRKWNGGDL